ncbi:MFS transporter [Microbulbifer agarilyticus]|uniref:MFS transporter n=1 Tax=Microbulbifer agarilyticus TaxID=260552 RepID=UPI001CD1E61F|nr:MFS transporter [Microbulbifer agarilyticus]MCA0894655.1 MFS transporter [Microbulbifer agarilyticus]
MNNAKTTLITVMLVTLIGSAGIALPYPVLAPLFLDGPATELTHFMGLPPKLLLGVALAVFPIGLLIGSSVLGALSDQFGRRRTLVLTLILAAAGYVLAALALSWQNFMLFIVARFVTGLCEGNIAIARAMAADLHPVIDRTRALSLAMSCAYAGWLLGPLSGGYLAVFGAAVVFWAGAAAVIVCALLAQLFLPADKPSAPASGNLLQLVRSENSLVLWREPAIRALALFNLLFCLGVNAFYEFYPFWLVEKFGYAPHDIAWNTVVATAVMITMSALAVPPMKKRFGANPVVFNGALVLGVLLALLPLANRQGAIVMFALIGASIATVNGVFPAIMSERFEQYGQGKVMGLLTANFCLTNAIIALLGSVLALLGSQWTLVLGGALCLGSAVWFAALHRASFNWPAKVIPR